MMSRQGKGALSLWVDTEEIHTIEYLQDVIFSFPVTCSGGKWTIKQGLDLDEFSKEKLAATGKELVEEKALALECLKEK